MEMGIKKLKIVGVILFVAVLVIVFWFWYNNQKQNLDSIMTASEISQFEKKYGWTPPDRFTQNQLLQFIKDNPDATPEELEEGAIAAKNSLEDDNSPTEEEVYNSPYVKHIRKALNAYIDGTNLGIESTALDETGGEGCGLNNYDKAYYKSKFIIFSTDDSKYGGAQVDIVFVDKPDTLFWAYVYRLGGDGEYVLRGFCENGPPEDKRTEFELYIEEAIKSSNYFL